MNLKDRMTAALDAEISAVQGLKEKINPDFESACMELADSGGKIICTGTGSSMIAAGKFAFNLQSAGVQALELDPEALLHGGISALSAGDILFVFSYSGEAMGLIRLLPTLKKMGVKVFLATGFTRSTLARAADRALEVGTPKEADPIGALPTSSFMALCALADAFGAAVMQIKGTTARELAARHPGGRLGHGIDVMVEDILRVRGGNPTASMEATFKEALVEMTSRGLGAISIMDADGKLAGIITDGDVRRLISRFQGNIARLFLSEVGSLMTKNPKRILVGASVSDAVQLMERNAITVLPVVDDENKPVGMIHLHDLVKISFGIQNREDA